MSIELLKKQIGEGEINNLYLFYGPEYFLVRKYLMLIEEKIGMNDFKDLNFSVFNGKNDNTKIIDTCQTLPFFSDKRLVIIKDSGIFKSSGKSIDDTKEKTEKKKKRSNDELYDFIKATPNHVCIVFVEQEVDKRTRYYEAVKQAGLIVEFDYQRPSDLSKWVISEFKTLRMQISSADAAYLVEYSEPGMTDIYTQIQKLAAYTCDIGVVSRDDIHKVCAKSIKRKIFDLTDAISERDAQKALTMLQEMIDLKEPVAKIFTMIARQFRNILMAKNLMGKGFNKGMLASKMSVHPYVAEKLFKQAANFEVVELQNAIRESYEMDLSNKNSLMDDRIAAEILIARFMKPVANTKGRVKL